jgi:hypothetical protein
MCRDAERSLPKRVAAQIEAEAKGELEAEDALRDEDCALHSLLCCSHARKLM